MNTKQIQDPVKTKEEINKYIEQIYGYPNDIIRKDMFLNKTWDTICSLVQNSRHHPLVQETVREYRNFCPRVFVLLTILHGSFSHEPRMVTILKDLVGLLGDDLTEREMQYCEYAKSLVSPYFPGLLNTWENIQHVYREKYFNLDVLPPTPHHAYVMYTLHNEVAIGRKTSPEEIFGTLSVMHAQMSEIHSIVQNNTAPK